MNEFNYYDECMVEDVVEGDQIKIAGDHLTVKDKVAVDEDTYEIHGHSEDTDDDVSYYPAWDEIVILWTFYDPNDYEVSGL